MSRSRHPDSGAGSGSRPVVRCAIYTRKSSDEGLDQAFNSLDAQREACAAYIASQKQEGWKLVPARYDDGGFSGGTMERPALQRMLADIDAGRIGMVVVHKIDRLSRSLADFSRLVERFDGVGCSFVSITQHFNTASSMGRLTLNVLLSFAQFEREMTGERIRDKIAASKKKGLWMGGLAPLGYDRHPDPLRRELVEAPDEAEAVRQLFRIYLERGCLRHAADEAARLGIRSKARVFASGRTSGGEPLSRGQLHYLLTNPVYRGMIRHRDQLFEGAHPAIVDAGLWEQVQEKLTAAAARGRGRRRDGRSGARADGGAASALCEPGSQLMGRLRDEAGDPLTPTHTRKGSRRYHYYVSHRCLTGRQTSRGDGWRLSAMELESTIAAGIARHLRKSATEHRVLRVPDAGQAPQIDARIGALADALERPGVGILRDVLASGTLAPGLLRLTLHPDVLADRLQVARDDLSPALTTFGLPFDVARRGAGLRLVSGTIARAPDPKLVAALARAHRWAAALRRGVPLRELAGREGRSEALVRTRAELAFLSPSIQTVIIEGSQPVSLTLERLVRTPIPLEWSAQEELFLTRA